MKTVCVYHSRDLDGWMSAAIVKHWFYKNNTKRTEVNLNVVNTLSIEDRQELESKINSKFKDLTIYFLGYDYGDPIPDLSEYDKVIMCDVSFPKEEMSRLWHIVDKELIWIDHHISAINDNQGYDNIPFYEGLQDTNFAACELTWKYLFPNETMPKIVRLLGRYDCFGHKGTDEEQKVLEFQYGARACMSNYQECYEKLIDSIQGLEKVQGAVFDTVEAIQLSGGDIYEYLCTEAKQTYKKAFLIEFIKTKLEIPKSDVFPDNPFTHISGNAKYKFLCVNQERFNPINFGIDYHKDGYDGFACFWYKDGKWMWSLYNDNEKVDCSIIAKQYEGGGHREASGFVCDNETMLKLIRSGE